MKDVVRAALAVPALTVADVERNRRETVAVAKRAEVAGASLILFPELSLTGYTCGDLFLSSRLLESARNALVTLTRELPEKPLIAVGAPLLVQGQVCNCAVLYQGGHIVGAVPKTYLPDYAEFHEKRHFCSGADISAATLTLGDDTFPIGTDLLFTTPDNTVVAVEICEDLWAPVAVSTGHALSGAEIILNLAASNEVVGRRAYRRELVMQQSAKTNTAYLFASAGRDESTADLIFSGHSMAALCGNILCENTKLIDSDYLLLADLDLEQLRYDRRHNRTFADCVAYCADSGHRQVLLPHGFDEADGAHLCVERLPFVPSTAAKRAEHCTAVFEMQTAALARRLALTGGKLTVGISGGLDSTLALLVAVAAMEQLSLPHANITAVTMPCFGTSDQTLANATELMERLGVTARTIPIGDSVLSHFRDIGHDPTDYSVTFENAQARERTQVLMDVANKEGGIVLGTGDLSEVALGWCTYNGDHMSMYGVNADVPKTLIRWIIETVSEQPLFAPAREVLMRVLDTPISPELLPPDAVGRIAQKTEDIVGPYALHDFFLYYAVRFQFGPAKIFALACKAFDGIFDGATVKRWLAVFWRRFFSQQFKRNCQPDGVKVGSVALSPRGDWHMPSDASAAEWLRELDEIQA